MGTTTIILMLAHRMDTTVRSGLAAVYLLARARGITPIGAMADIMAARDITVAVGTMGAVGTDTRAAVITVVAMLAVAMPAAVSMAANHTAAGSTVVADRMAGDVAKKLHS